MRAPVADVVVGGDFVAEESGDADEAVAENGAANVADMHWLGDIRGAEIDEDFFGLRGRGDAESRIGGEFGNGGGEKGVVEAEIQEAGAGDIGRGGEEGGVELGENLGGELARVGFFLLGEDHGGVGLVIAEARVGGLGDFAARGVEVAGGERGAEAGGEEFARGGHEGVLSFKLGGDAVERARLFERVGQWILRVGRPHYISRRGRSGFRRLGGWRRRCRPWRVLRGRFCRSKILRWRRGCAGAFGIGLWGRRRGR